MYPLVRELAVDGIPVTVSCRVLGLARAPFYRWLESPFTDAQLDEAWLANAIFDAHRDDPEFGYRFLADEIRRRVSGGVGSGGVADLSGSPLVVGVRQTEAFQGVQAGHAVARRPGARDFTAPAPNQLWLSDITEHWTREGKIYCCAIKDVFSNRIVGWAIDERMKARLVVAAIEMAVARRR